MKKKTFLILFGTVVLIITCSELLIAEEETSADSSFKETKQLEWEKTKAETDQAMQDIGKINESQVDETPTVPQKESVTSLQDQMLENIDTLLQQADGLFNKDNLESAITTYNSVIKQLENIAPSLTESAKKYVNSKISYAKDQIQLITDKLTDEKQKKEIENIIEQAKSNLTDAQDAASELNWILVKNKAQKTIELFNQIPQSIEQSSDVPSKIEEATALEEKAEEEINKAQKQQDIINKGKELIIEADELYAEEQWEEAAEKYNLAIEELDKIDSESKENEEALERIDYAEEKIDLIEQELNKKSSLWEKVKGWFSLAKSKLSSIK